MILLNIAALAGAEAEAAPALRAELLHTWTWPLLPLVGLVLGGGIYLRGWFLARRTRPVELPPWRAISFVAGLVALWMAIASPIDAFDDYLLAGHMIQHFILMSVAPPLLVLGAPVVPLLRGLPRWATRRPLQWFFKVRWLQQAVHFLSHPALIWLAMNVSYLGWHVPRAFELTFRSEAWHNTEHLCFFTTSVAFWYVVVEPWPARPRWPRWAAVPYLLTADIVNTILSALLTFSGRALYSSYVEAPRVCSLTPLQDQIAAGTEMWVLNSIVFLVPGVVITMGLFSPKLGQPKLVKINEWLAVDQEGGPR